MSHPIWKARIGGGETIHQKDNQAAIAEFIRAKGITRCPTACLVPTQGSVGLADRAALEQYALAQEKRYQEKASLEMGFSSNVKPDAPKSTVFT